MMKKEIGLAIIVILLTSGVGYAGLFGKSDKEVEEEIKKRETVLTASFNETLTQKNRTIAEKDAEIQRLRTEKVELTIKLEEASKILEETSKKLRELEEKVAAAPAPPPAQETVQENRTLQEIITAEITKYAQVIPSGDGLKIIFNTDFFFYFDVPESAIYRSLDVIVKALKSYPDHRIIVTGYTDSYGSAKINLQTSLIKAKAVANYLIAKEIPEDKIIVKGLGSACPIDTNKTKEGRKQNRRIEVIIK